MFLPDVKTADIPQDEIKGQWLVASPETAGRFTAVGYYFARKLNRECGLSVGLLNPACGGSLIQAWTCGRHLESAAPAVAESAQKELNNYRNYRTLRDAHVRELLEWEKDLQWVDDAKTNAPPADAEWRKTPSLTGRFHGAGVVWFRKSIELTPADVKDGGVFLWIGRPLVETRIFWDGRPVMTLTRERAIENWPFRFKVATTPGKHTMMMRVSATEREFGFPRENLVGSKPNAGGWEYARERDFPAASPEKLAARPRFLEHRPYHNEVPGLLWNSMLHPILPYTIKGTLWYQGESNSGPKGHLYGSQLAALVTCLREDFQQPEMRFYAVQLPEHHPKNANPNVMGYWTEIRAGQSKTIGTLPFASEIVTLGLGESGDIHPLDKQPVGERLAALAMRNDYEIGRASCRERVSLAV